MGPIRIVTQLLSKYNSIVGNTWCIPLALNLDIASELIEAAVWSLAIHMALICGRGGRLGGREVGGRDNGREVGGRREAEGT